MLYEERLDAKENKKQKSSWDDVEDGRPSPNAGEDWDADFAQKEEVDAWETSATTGWDDEQPPSEPTAVNK